MTTASTSAAALRSRLDTATDALAAASRPGRANDVDLRLTSTIELVKVSSPMGAARRAGDGGAALADASPALGELRVDTGGARRPRQ